MEGSVALIDDYLPRIVDAELDELLESVPAVAIEGPRAVGKTQSAFRRSSTQWLLDDPQTLALAEADAARILQGTPPTLIDEWQRYPAIWDLVRRAVDRGAAPGSYILTGSAAPIAGGTHSGAGRIVNVRMRTMSLAERGVEHATVSLAHLLTGERPDVDGSTSANLELYVDEILRGGFPGIRKLASQAGIRAQLDSYVERLVDHDFANMGIEVRNTAALSRWVRAYAAAISTTASYEAIRDAATSGEDEKPAKTTVIPYRDALERLWLVDQIPAWTPSHNLLRELARAEKHFVADPALAARLVGQTKASLLSGDSVRPDIPRPGTFIGALFEGLVANDVRVYAQANDAEVRHLRTYRGRHEVDLLVLRPDGRLVAVEVKMSANPSDEDTKHLHWLASQLGEQLLDSIVITSGTHAYRRDDGVAMVPAALLGP